MLNRRLLMAQRSEEPPMVLPDQYQAVEYLENSSNANGAYINTEVLATRNTTFSAKYSIIGDAPSQALLGRRKSFTENNFSFWAWADYDYIRYIRGNGELAKAGQSASHVVSDLRYPTIVTASVDAASVKNELIDETIRPMENSITPMVSVPVYLFSCNTPSGAMVNQTMYGRVYWCKFFEDGILIRDFVPCIRKTDSKPGMYDFVTRRFYTNVGKRSDFTWA